MRKSKHGPKATDIRAMVAGAELQNDGAVALTLDWTTDYMSPKALALAVNDPISPLAVSLLKVGQEFAGK